MIMEWKKSSKQNKMGQLTIQNYTFKRVEIFKCLGVILNEDNKHQVYLQERTKTADKTYCMLQKCFRNEIYLEN